MILLTSNNILRLTTSSAGALDVYLSYEDRLNGSPARRARKLKITTATDTALLTTPPTLDHILVNTIFVRNISGSTSNVTSLSVVDGANVYRVYQADIDGGEGWSYDGLVFTKYDAVGRNRYNNS